MLAGPYCTYLLKLLGAEILKVEIPGGEMGRRMAPPGPLRDAGLGAAFLAQAAGKRMLAVDIRKLKGAEILRRLLRNADVFVEGLRPGAGRLWWPVARRRRPRLKTARGRYRCRHTSPLCTNRRHWIFHCARSQT